MFTTHCKVTCGGKYSNNCGEEREDRNTSRGADWKGEKQTDRKSERHRKTQRERERGFRQSSVSLINDCSERRLDSNMSITQRSSSHCFLSPPRAGKYVDRMKIRRRPCVSTLWGRAPLSLSLFLTSDSNALCHWKISLFLIPPVCPLWSDMLEGGGGNSSSTGSIWRASVGDNRPLRKLPPTWAYRCETVDVGNVKRTINTMSHLQTSAPSLFLVGVVSERYSDGFEVFSRCNS